MVYEPISHNLHIKHTVVSLNLKGSLKTFPHETIAANENRFPLELNDKEVIELLECFGLISWWHF